MHLAQYCRESQNSVNNACAEEKSKTWLQGNPFLSSAIPQGPMMEVDTGSFVMGLESEPIYNEIVDDEDLTLKECPLEMVCGTIWERPRSLRTPLDPPGRVIIWPK